MQYTLQDALKSQGDYGQKSIDRTCEDVENKRYRTGSDPITDIIVNAHISNSDNLENIISDLDYAIAMLTRVRNYVESCENDWTREYSEERDHESYE